MTQETEESAFGWTLKTTQSSVHVKYSVTPKWWSGDTTDILEMMCIDSQRLHIGDIAN